MNVRALDRKLMRDLWRLRGQVLAIAAVIMGGVATLVMSLSTYDSLVYTRDRFYAEYRFADVFALVERAPQTVAERLRELPGVGRIETRVRAAVKLQVEGFDDPINGLIFSLPDGGEPELNRLYLRRGRLPAPLSSDEAVVTDTFAEAHGLAPGDTIAAIINGRWRRLTLVGIAVSPEYIYQIAPGAMFPDFKRYGVLWMGRQALAAAYDMEGAFNSVALSLAPGASARAVIDELDELLARYGGIGAFARAEQFSNRFLSEELKTLATTARIFPAIFLGVAAFLLNVVLTRTISLQRGEIAILKAFGYGDLAIGLHYLKFTLAVALLGVAAGLGLGAWFGHSLATVYQQTTFRFPYLHYLLTAEVIALALAAGLLASVIGALIALVRAVRLTPAEGMRPEAPMDYRATGLERLDPKRRLAPASRMILRHIGRRPVRSALTVLGIACACALMMVGNYQKGAVDYIIDLQFRHAAREDLAVVFTAPTSARVLSELRALPGVYHAEGYRDVAVILRHGPHRYRGWLYGLEPAGRLHRALDTELRPVAVPAGGVVLTDHLAREVLHIRPGQTLTIEVLEGRRPVLQVPVLGLTRQYLGVSAYVQRDTLNRLLREGAVLTGAYLGITAGDEARVYAELNRRPRVLGMIANHASIESFYASMGQFVLFYNLVATLLAASIAFGVIYNGARIALSERSRELASLRVLGYTRGEVAYILLGELALLTLAAIPLGFLIGVGLTALVVEVFRTDLYRLPLILEPSNYALGAAVVLASALVCGLVLWRQLSRLDLIGVLKTRE
ncbi:MAG: ABC transporter permease [Thiobacillaceae bacterium]|nr:ABC transporter permease [Thiobacillaceae bacterium]